MPLNTNTTLYAPSKPKPKPEPVKLYPEGAPSGAWRKTELLAWAEENGLAVDGLNTKAEILDAIEGSPDEGEG